jgi:hypothetical protein
VTICPCCGFKSDAEMSAGCRACGACPVGEALPKPEHELPSYGRSLVLFVMGALLVLVFATQTFVALTQFSARGAKSNLAFLSMIPFDPSSWLAAGETAAWRMKWIAVPMAILVFWFGRKLYQSIAASPDRFCGVRYARRGLYASAAVPVLILILIGLTVPVRLEHRQWGIEAQQRPYIHRIDRAFDEYREAYSTLPSDVGDLRRLPDPDGSLAVAMQNLDLSGYRPSAELAAVPDKKLPQLRGAVIRNASSGTADDAPGERLSFTNYELPLPGPDRIMGTEDDLIVRDGVTYQASEAQRRPGGSKVASKTLKP